MAIQVYNEGRVVGLSSYESYVRRFLSDNPTGTPASESEWLASSLAMGSSLVLTVPTTGENKDITYLGRLYSENITPTTPGTLIIDIQINSGSYVASVWDSIMFESTDTPDSFTATQVISNLYPVIDELNRLIQGNHQVIIYNNSLTDIASSGQTPVIRVVYSDESYHTIDISLPVGTNLRAANTVYGAYTNIELDNATKVAVYSNQLIPNNATTHPATGYVQASNLPTDISGYTGVTQQEINKLLNYSKIQDGVILQSGTWAATSATPPTNDLNPDLSAASILRLLVKGAISTSFNILLTGFTDAGVLSGIVSTTGSTATTHPENGDFLGPATFPWASKVVFVVDNNTMNATVAGGLPKILSLLSNDLTLTENGNYTLAQEKSLATGKPYILINDVRLYVSTTEPQGQPVHISGVQAPSFVANKYYYWDEDEQDYYPLETVPDDWVTNYSDYFYYDAIPDGSIGIGWINS